MVVRTGPEAEQGEELAASVATESGMAAEAATA